jgi:hypothetical protein
MFAGFVDRFQVCDHIYLPLLQGMQHRHQHATDVGPSVRLGPEADFTGDDGGPQIALGEVVLGGDLAVVGPVIEPLGMSPEDLLDATVAVLDGAGDLVVATVAIVDEAGEVAARRDRRSGRPGGGLGPDRRRIAEQQGQNETESQRRKPEHRPSLSMSIGPSRHTTATLGPGIDRSGWCPSPGICRNQRRPI